MKKTKKVNPRNRPVSQADLEKAQEKACRLAMSIFLTVLCDYYDYSKEQIQDVYYRSNKLAEEIKEGRISLFDLVDVLYEEYGVMLK